MFKHVGLHILTRFLIDKLAQLRFRVHHKLGIIPTSSHVPLTDHRKCLQTAHHAHLNAFSNSAHPN